MSVSHPSNTPNGGDTPCDEVVASPDWDWLTKRFETAADDDFGQWLDDRLSLLESDLSEFGPNNAASVLMSSRRS